MWDHERNKKCGRCNVLWTTMQLLEKQRIMGDYLVFWEKWKLWENEKLWENRNHGKAGTVGEITHCGSLKLRWVIMKFCGQQRVMKMGVYCGKNGLWKK
jgi:hypothetical protein